MHPNVSIPYEPKPTGMTSVTRFPKGNTTRFDNLVEEIRTILGPSSGIDSEDIDVEDLIKTMEAYTSDSYEWSRYAFADLSRAYTRNFVDEGNGKANLLILVWSPGKGSVIHDHANAHCKCPVITSRYSSLLLTPKGIMKVLKGRLEEKQFEWPGMTSSEERESKPLRLKKSTVYRTNEVAYISDNVCISQLISYLVTSVHPKSRSSAMCVLVVVKLWKLTLS